jgi:hypothetical protein
MMGLAIGMSLLISLLGVGIGAADGDHSFIQVILPPLPFLVLAGLSLIKTIPVYGVIGAAVGAVMADGIPYALLVIAEANYSGGAANIGLGLLLLAMPVYLPIVMIIGYDIDKKAKHMVAFR